MTSYPLSQTQLRVWMNRVLRPDLPSWNNAATMLLDSDATTTELYQAAEHVSRRYAVLRSRVDVDGDRPMARLMSDVGFPVEVIDVTGWDHQALEDQITGLIHAPVDLTHGPLLRLVVFSWEHWSLLCVVADPLIADESTIGRVVGELVRLIRDEDTGNESESDDLALLSAYAHFQSDLRHIEESDPNWIYWKDKLAGDVPVLNLPLPQLAPDTSTLVAETHFRLDPTLVRSLAGLAESHGCHLRDILATAFQILLYRYTDQPDLWLGFKVDGRRDERWVNLLGNLENDVVLRARMSDDLTILELLGQTARSIEEATQHGDIPLAALIERLDPHRSVNQRPLYRAEIVFRSTQQPSTLVGSVGDLIPDTNDCRLHQDVMPRIYRGYHNPTDLALAIALNPTQVDVIGSFISNGRLIDQATINRLNAHFEVVLRAIAEDPRRTISVVPILTEAECQQIVIDWNNTEVEIGFNQCLHEAFEEQVRRTPHATAVTFEGQSLSYDSLNCRANQLAHYLRRKGVKTGDMVGICVHRSLEMVVGIYGILKAGAAYVPIDPSYPAERIEFMVSDAQMKVLITEETLRGVLPPSYASLVLIDREGADIAKQSTVNFDSGSSPDNCAYVIYTSGTTGRPKGVLNTHSGTYSRARWFQQTYPLTNEDRVLQQHTYSFMSSVREFVWPLISGATLVLPKVGGHQDPGYLVKLMAEQQITVACFVPSLLNALLDDPDIVRCASLRHVICGGELPPVALPERFFARLPQATLRYCYGVTENAGTVTSRICSPGERRYPILMGRPIGNTRIYVLDQRQQPVPVGVVGELYVGGVGLAKGYLNQTALTAERFLPDPFSPSPEARLYRTGDLARLWPSGDVEILGRADQQVKIRGFRIELGEIESVLSKHPEIHEIAVTAPSDSNGRRRIIAYVVPIAGHLSTSDSLRQYTAAYLPDYMVPSAVVFLPTLPRTAHGKIDSHRLPLPDTMDERGRPAYAAPRTPVEEKLAEIWQQLLDCDRVGIQDNFFDLGGDSILCMQLVSRARQAGYQFSPGQVFQHQTIAELAPAVRSVLDYQTTNDVTSGDVALTPPQHLFFQYCEQNSVDIHHRNTGFLLRSRRQVDAKLVQETLRHLVKHHDALRLRFARQESGWRAFIVDSTSPLSFDVVDLVSCPDTAVNAAVESVAEQANRSLNICAGPIVATTYFDLGPKRPARVLIIAHHLVTDGISWRILLEDLQTAYDQLSNGQSIHLPEKTTSFQSWGRRMTEYAHSQDLRREIPFWMSQSTTSRSCLPVDNPSGANTMSSVDTVTVSIPPDETSKIVRSLPRRFRVEVGDIILAALTRSVARWSGQSSLEVTVTGHGREEIFPGVNLSRTVGWFNTLFPVRLDLASTHTVEGAVEAIGRQMRQIPNRGLGYGVLRYLSPDTSVRDRLAAIPQPEIQFNYQGQYDHALAGAGAFALASESSGPKHGKDGYRDLLFQVSARVSEGRLQLSWRYSANLYRRETVERAAESMAEELRKLVHTIRNSPTTLAFP